MIRYIHFALPNLYLANGYREFATPDGIERQYEREDELEHCVQRILVRKPRRLRGWDLRFLRHGLRLSQPQFGQLIDRNAQSVARWEKSERTVPTFVDLAVRLEFAAKFESKMTVAELRSYVHEQASPFPSKILLHLNDAGWQFNLKSRQVYTVSTTESIAIAFSDLKTVNVCIVGAEELHRDSVRQSVSASINHSAVVTAVDETDDAGSYWHTFSTVSAAEHEQLKTTSFVVGLSHGSTYEEKMPAASAGNVSLKMSEEPILKAT